MPKRDVLEESLAALRAIAGDGDSPASRQVLLKSLESKFNLVAGKAAGMIEERGIKDFAFQLEAAFTRFMRDPAKSDKGCAAKIAIAKAIYTLDISAEKLFRAGIHHFQPEPTFGGSVDTAAELRGHCALGLVRMGYKDVLTELADLLMDQEPQARMMAARAIAYAEREEGALLLRIKILAGDKEIDVMAECFAALLRLSGAKGVALVARFLDAEDADLRDSATLALGASKLAAAFEVLRERWERVFQLEGRGTLLLAIATIRSSDSLNFLLSILEEGRVQPALDALEALRIYRHDETVWKRVEAGVAAAENSELMKHFREL